MHEDTDERVARGDTSRRCCANPFSSAPRVKHPRATQPSVRSDAVEPDSRRDLSGEKCAQGSGDSSRTADEAADVYDRGAATYGDNVADMYDAMFSDVSALDPAEAVAALAALAGPGPVLELGIGTGRVALPLRARGLEVHGIDASRAMIDELRCKQGGSEIPVTLGDFAAFDLSHRYTLIYIVFNTLFHLRDQEAQLSCFRCAADHLVDEGVFLVEAYTPAHRVMTGRPVRVWGVRADAVDIGFREYQSVVEQTYVAQHVRVTDGKVRLNLDYGREVWPGELDLMARLVGLQLRERWGDWRRNGCAPDAASHVSVYARAADTVSRAATTSES